MVGAVMVEKVLLRCDIGVRVWSMEQLSGSKTVS